MYTKQALSYDTKVPETTSLDIVASLPLGQGDGHTKLFDHWKGVPHRFLDRPLY